MIILKLSGQREVNLILSEFGLGVTKEELVDIMGIKNIKLT